MTRTLTALWRGELPLRRAFWDFAILYGVLVNLAATGGYLGLLSAGVHPAIGLAVYFAPLPYNVAVFVGVWRSADRYSGPAHWADAARAAITLWLAVATLA